MRKILTVLFSLGFICLLLTILLRIGGWKHTVYINFAADFSLMVAMALVPFLPDYRPREIKILSTLFCIGGVLIFAGELLRDLHLPGRKFVVVAGSLLMLFSVLIYLLLFLTGRVQTKQIEDKYAQAPIVELTTLELDTCTGNYLETFSGNNNNKQLPFEIVFTSDGKALTAQATDQQPFAMEAIGNHTFRFTKAGIVIIFEPANNKLLLKQHGREFPFVKVN